MHASTAGVSHEATLRRLLRCATILEYRFEGEGDMVAFEAAHSDYGEKVRENLAS